MKKRKPNSATPSKQDQRAMIRKLAAEANSTPMIDEREIDEFINGALSATEDFKEVLMADENPLKMPIGERLRILGLYDEMNMAWALDRQRKLLTGLAQRRHDAGIGAILRETQAARAASERAEAAAKNTADMIRSLRPEWLTGETKAPKQYVKAAGTIKIKIFDLWRKYEHDPQYNGGRKADFATFLEIDGGREIRDGETLQEFIERQAEKDEKKRTPEELIARIIRSEGERRRKGGKGQKPTSRQLRAK